MRHALVKYFISYWLLLLELANEIAIYLWGGVIKFYFIFQQPTKSLPPSLCILIGQFKQKPSESCQTRLSVQFKEKVLQMETNFANMMCITRVIRLCTISMGTFWQWPTLDLQFTNKNNVCTVKNRFHNIKLEWLIQKCGLRWLQRTDFRFRRASLSSPSWRSWERPCRWLIITWYVETRAFTCDGNFARTTSLSSHDIDQTNGTCKIQYLE